MPWLEHDFTTWNKPLKWVIIYDVKICIFHKITQIRTWKLNLEIECEGIVASIDCYQFDRDAARAVGEHGSSSRTIEHV